MTRFVPIGTSCKAGRRFRRSGKVLIALAIAILVAVLSGALGVLVTVGSSTAIASSQMQVALPPGDYITFSCDHSVVSVTGGNVLCNDQSSVTMDMCDSSRCLVNMTDNPNGVYSFSSWSASGDAFFGASGSGCSSSHSSTSNPVQLCMNVPNTASRYSGSVTANVV